MKLTDDDCETLGLLVDKLDNAAHAAVLPIPDKLHKEALTGIVGDARDQLKAFLVERGFNPWSD
jgi:hypothetical protein